MLTTRSEKGQEVAENLLNGLSKPRQPTAYGYLTSPTLRPPKGGCICGPVLDLYSRRVVGWSLSSCVDTELVLAAVAMAVIRRRPPRGLMFHSDRGVQYTSAGFKAIADGHGFIQSIDRPG